MVNTHETVTSTGLDNSHDAPAPRHWQWQARPEMTWQPRAGTGTSLTMIRVSLTPSQPGCVICYKLEY